MGATTTGDSTFFEVFFGVALGAGAAFFFVGVFLAAVLVETLALAPAFGFGLLVALGFVPLAFGFFTVTLALDFVAALGLAFAAGAFFFVGLGDCFLLLFFALAFLLLFFFFFVVATVGSP